MLKRIFDLAVSFIGIVLVSPLLILIAIWIRLDSPGPVFYRGIRVGLYGKPFRIYKFRTMMPNADATGVSSTASDDPRITGVGRFLRNHKLDELPQLFNVVKGEMSIVGPRPQVPWAFERYADHEKLLVTVRPGFTDPASIRFKNEGEILRGSTDPDRDYFKRIHPEKMRLSLEYVRTRSLWGDFKIIAQTIGALLEPKWKRGGE